MSAPDPDLGAFQKSNLRSAASICTSGKTWASVSGEVRRTEKLKFKVFKNGLRHGKGKWHRGETKYNGGYVEGLKEGYGELYYSNGNFYKGNFVEDKREGYG